MQTYDIAIIGAGIAGASLAATLAGHSGPGRLRLIILEAEEQPGYHTTGRSAALYSPLYGNGAIRALTTASRPFFSSPPPGFSEHPLLTPRGCLHVAGPGDTHRLETMAAEATRLGETAIPLTAAAAAALVPVLREDAITGALHEPEAMDIDVHSLHQGFLRCARAAGAVLRTDAAVTAITRGHGGWELAIGADRVGARIIVNAAGAWADVVAVRAGVATVGLRPLRRTAALIAPPAGVDIHRWPAVIDAAERFYFKPDAGLVLVSPADETPSPPCDAQPDELDIAIGIDRVQGVAELPVKRVVRSWAGLRSFVTDRTPVIGFAPDHPGFFWLAGQGGYGIQTAPAMAELAAGLMLEGAVPRRLAALDLDADLFAPTRPGLSDPTTHQEDRTA